MSIKKYIVRDFKEWEGVPLFYLPVMLPHSRYAFELWPFFLAPFVLLFQIIRSALWNMWLDTNYMISTLASFANQKSKKTKLNNFPYVEQYNGYGIRIVEDKSILALPENITKGIYYPVNKEGIKANLIEVRKLIDNL